jgi:hypothetical protein
MLVYSCRVGRLLCSLPPWLIFKASNLYIRRNLVSHLSLSQYASGTPSTGPLSIFLLVLQINSQCTPLAPPPPIAPHSLQHLSNYAYTLYVDRGRSASPHNYLAFTDFAKQSRTNALWSTRLFDLRSRPIRVRRSSEYGSNDLGI